MAGSLFLWKPLPSLPAAMPPSPRGRLNSPSLAFARQPPLGWGPWHSGTVSGSSAKLALSEVTPSVIACGDAPFPKGTASVVAAQFPAKVQSFRARQRLPLRGSWQNRQVLTEGVRFNSSCEKAILENPQIFQNCEIINILSADDAQSNAERIPNRRPPPTTKID